MSERTHRRAADRRRDDPGPGDRARALPDCGDCAPTFPGASDRTRVLPGRREFIAVGIGALGVALAPGLLRRRERLVRRSIPVMGTIAEVAVVHRDTGLAQRAIEAAFAELERVDRTMTRFRDDSDVGRANLAAARGPVAVSSETAFVLDEALHWAGASDGLFDPCIGAAVRLWDLPRRTIPPPPEAVRALASRHLHRALEVERGATVPRVRYHDPQVSIDLGGIAKGYGVDRAATALRDHGVFRGLVNVGGDLAAIGAGADGEPWRIGIRDPADPSGVAAVLEVQDRSVATSGVYEQSFEDRGRRYHHLLDPETGEPRRTRMRTLTILADHCVTADAAATTVFGLSLPHASGLLRAVSPDARIAHVG